MLDCYRDIEFSDQNKEHLACPYLNTKAIKSFGYVPQDEIWKKDGMAIYPGRYFDPLAPGDTQTLLCSETVSVHHYAASWTGTKNVYKRKAVNLIGRKNINRLKKINCSLKTLSYIE